MNEHDIPAFRVECYAGYRGEQTPRVLVLGDRRVEVAQVLDQWLAPDHRYFKLLDHEGHTYIVRHDTSRDSWDLASFTRRSGRAECIRGNSTGSVSHENTKPRN